MQTKPRILTALTLASLATGFPAIAQDSYPPVAVAAYIPAELPSDSPAAAPATPKSALSQQEIDQILAPIALYPDGLLSQILMAATYPFEVVQAARWSRANPGLAGDEAVQAVEQQAWDPSVKSLVAFPAVLAMMDENIDWTERLGDAFLAQQTQVTLAVQNLRQQAQANGSLASNNRMRVEEQDGDIVLQPANPQEVYVPYYDPAAVYGPWLWPANPPVYFNPPVAYYSTEGAFYWAPPVFIAAGFFFGGFDWHHHCVNVVNVSPFYYRPGFGHPHGPIAGLGAWQHDPAHRHGVAYSSQNLRQQYGGRTTQNFATARGDSHGQIPASSMPRAPAMVAPVSRANAPAEQRVEQRMAVPTTGRTVMEAPVFRERSQAATYSDFGGVNRDPSRLIQARPFMGATQYRGAQYSFHAAAYAPAFSRAVYAAPRAYQHEFSRPMGGGSAPHYGGGGGHSGGGGGHGGGHGGGRR